MKWKLKNGEKFWVIRFKNTFPECYIDYEYYSHLFVSHAKLLEIGNYFKDEEEAQAKLKQVLELLKK